MPAIRILSIVVLLTVASAPAATAQEPPPPEGWVVIPVDDYRALRTRAFPPVVPPDPPPVDAAVTRIEYDLTAGGDAASGTASLTVDVLKDGWVKVLIPTGLLVRDARVGTRPVSLVDKPQPHVLLSSRGRTVLTLQVVLPVTARAGAESVVIPPAPAALVRTSLRIPRSGVDLVVSNGFVSSQSETEREGRWIAHGRGHEPMMFTWRRRVEDRRAEQPLRYRGSVTSLVGLGEDSTTVTAAVSVEVVQGLAEAIDIAVPPGVTVNGVSGPLVADWETTSATTLRVTFLEPASGTAAFNIAAELRAPATADVSVPLLRLPGAERENGGVAVEVLGAGEITGRQLLALDPADPSDLGDVVSGRESPSLLAFRFKPAAGRDPRRLDVHVSRYATQSVLVANVDEARYQALVAEDGKMLVRARYAVRNNQRNLMAAALPPDATLWSAAVAGRPVRPGLSTQGALLVPLEKGQSRDDLPPFVVELVYLARLTPWNDKGDARIVLPALDLPVSRTGLVLHHSPRVRVTPEPGAFRVEPYTDPFSMELRRADGGSLDQLAAPPAAPAAVGVAGNEADRAAAAMQDLAVKFRTKDGGRSVAGVLPVNVAFPEFGPSTFLASELTPETTAPVLALEYQRHRDN
jgi:hypothetical protein